MKNTELTDQEFDRLSEILESLSPDAMNLEMLDGFFAALICSPDMVMPNEYLPIIFGGEDYSFDSEEQAMEFFNLTMRHWNFIADELLQTLKKPHVYLPILFEDENGIKLGNDWAIGFMKGTWLSHNGWGEFMNDEDHAGSIIPIMMLYHEHDDDEETRTPPIPLEQREDIIMHMIAGLVHIYKFFAPHRSHPTFETIKRTAPKVGRNDPCPCGSNRKYKHCCGDNKPTIH